jgi:pimeloyl-ACP methyl ester carboxylesterase
MTVYNESHMQGERLRAYLVPLTGPIGQPSFFQHQVRFYDSRYTEEITSRLHELGKLPVLLLWGREDRWQPLSYGQRLARAIPGAELEVLEQAGHFLLEDRPGECTEAILSFLHRQAVHGRENASGE